LEAGSPAWVVGRLRLAVRFQERLQGGPVLVEGELAGADVAQGTRCLVRYAGFDGGPPRSFKSLPRFRITPSLEEPFALAQKCIQGSPARTRFVAGCQGLRPDPRPGSWRRADERDYEQATSQDFGCFQKASAPIQKYVLSNAGKIVWCFFGDTP
jgi:hypothetical protein